MSNERATKKDAIRAFERHLETIREAGIPAERAELEISRPGDGHGTRFRPVNVPTLPGRTYCGAREAFEAITAATWTVQATTREASR